jgi:hypothetical protein
MKSYPTIPSDVRQGMSVYAFGKIDGSNIRAEWSRKAGFYKFGSRHRLLGTDQDQIPEAEQLIRDGWAESLIEVFKSNGWERAIVFFEFWGDNSFAGLHHDEPHRVSLIDVNPYKKGILPPKEFLDLFGHLDIAPLLYHGPCDGDFVESVRKGTLEGMPFEGVVCKAKHPKKTPMPVMFKIKSDAWYKKLKELCKGDEKMFEQLR